MSDDTKKEKTNDKEEVKEEKTNDKQEESSEEVTKEESKEEKQEESTAEDSKQEAEKAESNSDDDNANSSEEEEGEDIEIPEKFQTIVSEIENMSVLDLNELVKLLEKKFGVSAVAAAAPAGGGGDEGGEEEKDSFTVNLTDVGDQKIAVIKAVKNGLGLGLKEAKDMVDNLPATLKEDMPKADAEELKSAIEEAGGSVELK